MNYFTIDTIPAVNNYRLFGENIVYLDNKNRLYFDGNLVDTEVDYFDVFGKEIYFERNGKTIEFNIIEKSKKQYFSVPSESPFFTGL